MEKGFELFFREWIKNKNVILVTGSDKDKTIEQIGLNVWKEVTRVYQSCGNQVWQKGKLLTESPFFLEDEVEYQLSQYLTRSEWTKKFGSHIEQRMGLVNFSIIGRECPQDDRLSYYRWDKEKKERIWICNDLMKKFPDIEASVGGQISIDIYPKGKNKAQVLDDINGEIYFFGDKMDKGGNDYPIAHRLVLENRIHTLFNVQNPNETWNILKTMN